ncbi:uncharacterized protein LOC134185705 isoform X2 [Corticium candelabrum]|uniref:uncharacterized protein LOC134185705 isoform X2 n=1 Tax=Corticium candelabrum TaxID=121492 RepID=UPI002E26FBA3|nr:uncharacterized protein LOC134185705 isoform X2 [Corticium candelabrum]
MRLLLISVLLTVLLYSLTSATIVTKIYSGESNKVQTLIGQGLRDFVFPLFKNSTAALTAFNETEFAEVLAKKTQAILASNRTQTSPQTVIDMFTKTNKVVRKCNSAVQRKCPKCVEQKCKQKADTCLVKKRRVLDAIKQLTKKKFGQVGEFVKWETFKPAQRLLSDSKLMLDGVPNNVKVFIGDINVNAVLNDKFKNITHLVGSFYDIFDNIVHKWDGIANITTKTLLQFPTPKPSKVTATKPPKFNLTKLGFTIPPNISLTIPPNISLSELSKIIPKFPKISLSSTPKVSIPDIKIPKFGSVIDRLGKRKKRKVNHLTSVDQWALLHHTVSRRSSQYSPKQLTCKEVKNDKTVQKACMRYTKRSACKTSCNATYACPELQTVMKQYQVVLSSYKTEQHTLNKTVEAYRQALPLYRRRLNEKLKDYCWGLDLSRYYHKQAGSSRPWYNITQILVSYNTETRQFVEVKATVDIGSDQNRYQGDIKLTGGFGTNAARQLAEKILEWYKQKLVDSKAC